MEIRFQSARVGLRNSINRIPFRYGQTCMTQCPQAVLGVRIEAGGQVQQGYSGDCLPPGWFDKTPGKSYVDQLREMLDAIQLGIDAHGEAWKSPRSFFTGWLDGYRATHAQARQRGYTPLLASFGAALVERAVMDAMCRAAGCSFASAVRDDLFELRPGDVHSRLAGLTIKDWLPPKPLDSVFVRHTVGLGDPLSAGDVPPDEKLDDGFPQTLEQYVAETGIRFFKVKVSNQLDQDLDRLQAIARVIERQRGSDYRVTLDGNEQYPDPEAFLALIQRIDRVPGLAAFWKNTICVEQPLPRHAALEEKHSGGIRDLTRRAPVIIDESDGQLESFATAMEIGYQGVSSKSCKGVVKSLLNAGLIWHANQQRDAAPYLLTGEDLCSVGIIPVQQDLCLTATLGLDHVERNGHHFHRGLSYLPTPQQQAALEAHGDFYVDCGGIAAPRLLDGRFRIGSLQCNGFGFAVAPDWNALTPPDQWNWSDYL